MNEGMSLEDVPELMQHIQSQLPIKVATRTSVLSKSWLHAWSTIPTLRFHVPNEQKRKQLKLIYIDNTLTRYLHDNIPIESFDLKIRVESEEQACLAEKWIRSVASKTCLEELSLAIQVGGASLNLPNEILSCENITKIRVSASLGMIHAVWMKPTTTNTTIHHHPPIINCVSIRELHLFGVRISQQLLDHILSSCILLAKIELKHCSRDLKIIKVKNLPCLNELEIVTTHPRFTSVEINHVPNLRLFHCDLHAGPRRMRLLQFNNAHSISLGRSVTELSLGGPGLVRDDASLDMIKSGFPFLESLTLIMTCWTLGSFHFTCDSIKRLLLKTCPKALIDVKVNAPKLLSFRLNGYTMPSLSFPISTILEEITFQFRLKPEGPFGASFFLKMREALELSSRCYLHITTHGSPLPLDMDLLEDLKTRLKFPAAMNVQTLSFETSRDKCLWENSPFFDAFFEICHPKHVFAKPDTWFQHNNHFCKLMLKEVLEKKTRTTAYWRRCLKHVQIRTSHHRKWETLSNSHKSFLGRPVPAPAYADFKLEWIKG